MKKKPYPEHVFEFLDEDHHDGVDLWRVGHRCDRVLVSTPGDDRVRMGGGESQYSEWWCHYGVERDSIAHEPEQGGGKHCGDHCGRHLVLVGVGGHTNEEGEEIAVLTHKSQKARGSTTIITKTTTIIEGRGLYWRSDLLMGGSRLTRWRKKRSCSALSVVAALSAIGELLCPRHSNGK